MKHEIPGPRGDTAAHETRDVDVRRLVWLTVVLILLIVVSLAVTLLVYNGLAARESAARPRPSTLTVRPYGALPPEPRLQQNPLADLRDLRAEEDAMLQNYGWVDRERNVVRLPIEKAMEIVVDSGLPARAEPPTQGGAPGNAASDSQGGLR
ncbi:MAG TPA: hypothetical protein VFP98_03645 [Candidatus Polarisedimenticolia bacterium]|nr:hypothetical protein [Candidatus Polarisedimenticolia bacterium]